MLEERSKILKRLMSGVKASWYNLLSNKLNELPDLMQKIININESNTYPPVDLIFNVFKTLDFNEIKAVIIGQDPYHGEGQAMGFSFSVPKKMKKLPPSLHRILKEAGISNPVHGDLTNWVKQGVLMLNTVLTVQKGKPNSHSDWGWQILTDHIIYSISKNTNNRSIVFMLWGSKAQEKKKFIDNRKHVILEAAHPSPLATKGGFLGCDHFNKCNQILKKQGFSVIDWDITKSQNFEKITNKNLDANNLSDSYKNAINSPLPFPGDKESRKHMTSENQSVKRQKTTQTKQSSTPTVIRVLNNQKKNGLNNAFQRETFGKSEIRDENMVKNLEKSQSCTTTPKSIEPEKIAGNGSTIINNIYISNNEDHSEINVTEQQTSAESIITDINTNQKISSNQPDLINESSIGDIIEEKNSGSSASKSIKNDSTSVASPNRRTVNQSDSIMSQDFLTYTENNQNNANEINTKKSSSNIFEDCNQCYSNNPNNDEDEAEKINMIDSKVSNNYMNYGDEKIKKKKISSRCSITNTVRNETEIRKSNIGISDDLTITKSGNENLMIENKKIFSENLTSQTDENEFKKNEIFVQDENIKSTIDESKDHSKIDKINSNSNKIDVNVILENETNNSMIDVPINVKTEKINFSYTKIEMKQNDLTNKQKTLDSFGTCSIIKSNKENQDMHNTINKAGNEKISILSVKETHMTDSGSDENCDLNDSTCKTIAVEAKKDCHGIDELETEKKNMTTVNKI